MASALEDELYGMAKDSAEKLFYGWHRFMFIGGYEATLGKPEALFFGELAKGFDHTSSRELEEALHSYYRRLSDPDDFNITLSKNDRTRENLWQSARSGCDRLSECSLFPHFNASYPGFANYQRTRTPVLADLSRNAGRFKDMPSAVENELAIVRENTELLALLRKFLEEILVTELKLFREGQAFARDDSLPSPLEVEDAIMGHEPLCPIRFGEVGSSRRLATAVKLLWSVDYQGFVPLWHESAIASFLKSAGSKKHSRFRSYLGATKRALTAAYYIIIIDTGWNGQPCDDLAADPFTGEATRGRRRLRSIASVKIRADSKEIDTPLRDDLEPLAEDQGYVIFNLATRRDDGQLSGVQVIEAWQEMTKPLRDRAKEQGYDEAAERLWIWRPESGGKARTGIEDMGRCWWPCMRDELKGIDRLSQLPITRRVLRKTVANIEAASGSFNPQISLALMDHGSTDQSKMYLTDETLDALFERKMRFFLDLWESMAVSNLEDAARKLGIPEKDLQRRRQLGLNSGLAFALARPPEPDLPMSDTTKLSDDATVFTPDHESMEDLHLARVSLRRMKDEIGGPNPRRWVRSWLAWHAIVEAVANLLDASRHRAAFRLAVASAEAKLANYTKTVPAIW